MKDFDDYAGLCSGEKADCIERDLATLRMMLAEYDNRLCDRELRGRGLPDVYRAGHFTRAANTAGSRVAKCGWGWMAALRESFSLGDDGVLFYLPPVRAFVRHLAAAQERRAAQ